MKNFKEWFTDRVSKTTTKALIPIGERAKLNQPFYALTDEKFLNVKIAEVEDAESILTIQKRCYNGQTPWTRAAIMHEIRFNRNAFYIIMYDQERPVAFVGSWFVSKEAHITNIATDPDYQNKGIGSYLLQEVFKLAEKEEFKEVTLEVRQSNKTAQSLYTTLGFEKGKIKRNYYADNREDALEMRRIVAPYTGD